MCANFRYFPFHPSCRGHMSKRSKDVPLSQYGTVPQDVPQLEPNLQANKRWNEQYLAPNYDLFSAIRPTYDLEEANSPSLLQWQPERSPQRSPEVKVTNQKVKQLEEQSQRDKEAYLWQLLRPILMTFEQNQFARFPRSREQSDLDLQNDLFFLPDLKDMTFTVL